MDIARRIRLHHCTALIPELHRVIDRASVLISVSLLLPPLLVTAQNGKPAAHAAPPAASGVPSRPLMGEMEKAEVGSAATVHTLAGNGPGMVLASQQEVLASLHLVLTPKGQVTPHIAVDISTPPQKPLTNIAASVIAQDPDDGLVLLKLAKPLPSQALAAAPVAAAPAPAPVEAHVRRHESGTSAPPVQVAQSEVAFPVEPTATSEQSFYVNNAPPRRPRRHTSRRPSRLPRSQHGGPTVVYDGPIPQ